MEAISEAACFRGLLLGDTHRSEASSPSGAPAPRHFNSLFHRQVLLIQKPKWPSSLTTRSLLTVMALVSPSFCLTRMLSPPPHWSPRIYSAPLNFHPSLLFPIVFRGVFSKCRSDLSFYAENPLEPSHIFCMPTEVSSRADKMLQRLAHPGP